MAGIPHRLVLPDVPQVKFFDGGPKCPEDIPFPSVMCALMEYLGEETYGCRTCRVRKPGCRIGCSYAFFIGVTGLASYLNWKPGWEGDNVEIMYMSDDPEAPFRRAFAATGYEYQIYGCDGKESDHGLFISKIAESLQNGRPVLSFGPIGPPESGLVTGYDEGGDVLIGWSFFQNFPEFSAGLTFEPTGEFRMRDWFEYPLGFSFLVIGEKRNPPTLKETYHQAIEWIIQVARTPITFGDRANGLAAYDAWADHVLRDEDFPADDAVLRQRHNVHNNIVGMLAEARWYGSQFLAGLAESVDDLVHRNAIEDLYQAAGLYAGEHALMWQVWDLVGGNGNPMAWQKFADPSVRRQIASVIRQARDKDARATDCLERVLACF